MSFRRNNFFRYPVLWLCIWKLLSQIQHHECVFPPEVRNLAPITNQNRKKGRTSDTLATTANHTLNKTVFFEPIALLIEGRVCSLTKQKRKNLWKNKSVNYLAPVKVFGAHQVYPATSGLWFPNPPSIPPSSYGNTTCQHRKIRKIGKENPLNPW